MDIEGQDRASEREELERQTAIKRIGADIPKGEPGDCSICGEWFGRLVQGACVPCRKQFKLP